MTVAILSCVTTMGWAEEPQADPRIDFNIPQQRADLALTEFAEQADLTLAVPRDVLLGKEANALIGSYTLQEGIDVLLAGTGLIPEFSNRIVLSIKTDRESVGEGKTMKSPKKATGLAAVLASIFVGGASAQELRTTDEDGEEFPEELEEISVTGTNIRGAAPVGAPVLSFDSEDLRKSGFATVEEFTRTVPQNFAGGATNLTNFGTAPGANSGNFAGGNGINIRGLGTEGTLVLLNGRRLAPSGAGFFVDVSTVPISSVARIEILTDGASAIYGSDAVSGVVNIILKDDVEGAETSFRYGTVTDGDRSEYQASQSIGANWDKGNALLSYEYREADALLATDRAFTSDVAEVSFLFPEDERHSLVGSLSQEIFPGTNFYFTGIYSDRDGFTTSRLSSAVQQDTLTDASQLSLAGGVIHDFNQEWIANIDLTFGRSDADANIVNNNVSVAQREVQSEVLSIDGKISGSLFPINGESVRVAVGGQFRNESFQRANNSVQALDTSRDVFAVFGEALIPFVRQKNSAPGLRELSLSIAGRYEDYSDIGSSFNPRFGARWIPFDDLTVRGSYGQSFRAPLLFQLDPGTTVFFPGATLASLRNRADPITGGTTPTIAILGNNPDLDPEESENVTVGIDYSPSLVPGLELSLTYFNVDYTGRIALPTSVLSRLLIDEAALGDLIIRAPDPALVNEIAVSSIFSNTLGIPIDQVGAIADNRVNNVASTKVNGLDFDASYSFQVAGGDITLATSGSYLFEFVRKQNAVAESQDIVSLVFNPADLRMRSSAQWNRDGFSAGAFLNYTSDFVNDTVDPEETVDSWVTADINIGYDFGNSSNWALRDLSATFAVTNLTDEDPPFRAGSTRGFNFDGANHSPLGRVVSISLRKRW